MTLHRPRTSTIARTLVATSGLLTLGLVVATALAEVPSVPVPQENPITESKRVLGKILFWEEQLSSDNTVACGTCHIPARNGTDPRVAAHPGSDGAFGGADDIVGSPGVVSADATGLFEKDATFGLAPQVTERATPPSIMAMYSETLFWDGRASGAFRDPVTDELLIATGGALESQAVGPPLSGVEMAHARRDWSQITTKLETVVPLALATDLPSDTADAIATHGSYPALFADAFGDEAITVKRIAFAIASYERTLIADQTPWDRFRAGQQSALNGAALRGWNAFQERRHACNECHEAPLFTDSSFRNIGIRPVSEDRGRQDVTEDVADRGKFKVPSLRNVGLKRTFMHNGEMTTLADVLRFYARGPGVQQFTDNLDVLIPPIRIPGPVQADIVAFLQTGLTDPRVAAETFPFDRPTLGSERATPNPSLLGTGTAGAGGRTPQMVAGTPPNLGNELFQLAVDAGTPGAAATLVMSASPPVGDALSVDEVVATITLAGSGAGEGSGAAVWPVPSDASRLGDVVYFQWRVLDPAAPGGVALSRVARATLEGAALESSGDPEEPVEPPVVPAIPVVADDASLYASKVAFVVDWKSHAAGDADDSLKLVARLNPRGATSAAGAVVTIAIGDDAMLTTSALAANGVSKGVSVEGVSYKVRFDASSGSLTLRARSLDLRDAVELSDAGGTGTITLPLVVRVEGIGLESTEVAGLLEPTYRTKSGAWTRGTYKFKRHRALDGVFGLHVAKAKQAAVGTHRVSLRGPLIFPAGAGDQPTGPLRLTIGDAETIVVPLAALSQRQRGSATEFAYDASAEAVAGLRSLRYDGRSHVLKVSTSGLASFGLPTTGALESDLPIRIEIPLASGDTAFETVVRLRRKSGTASTWSH